MTFKTLLVADIGRTHSRFARFQLDADGSMTMDASLWLLSQEATGLNSLLNRLREKEFPLSAEEADFTVLAVNGPVVDDVYCQPTGLSWTVDLSHALRDYGMNRVLLINDFVAQAYATRSPIAQKAVPILKGKGDLRGATLAIGAGSGLGKALLFPDGHGGYLALPSEGGHALFPFASGEEERYRRFLLDKMGEAALETDVVVSGRGVALLHYFLTGQDLTPEEAARHLISETPTRDWMSRFYGRICRDSALQFLARGGVYVAGGVAGRCPGLVTSRAFAEEFHHSATMAEILGDIPLFLMNDMNSGLWGAAFAGAIHLVTKSNASN